jgi:Ca2+-binding EF-hand superfamily protein
MSIRKPVFIATIASIAAALACTAYAGDEMANNKMSDETKPAKTAFADIDTNKDGSISSLEANEKNSWLAKNFNAIDTNKDGRISKEEFDKALS